ncbi:hypothetical protein ES703_117768 [subsurface metagenome]
MIFDSSERGLFSFFITDRSCSAVKIPSPVVWCSLKIIWPESSPPITLSCFIISSSTYLSPTFVVTFLIPIFLNATESPKLLIIVVTTVLFFSIPSSFNFFAHIAIILSPLTMLPFSSTAINLSPSPSKASPISALVSTTSFARFPG